MWRKTSDELTSFLFVGFNVRDSAVRFIRWWLKQHSMHGTRGLGQDDMSTVCTWYLQYPTSRTAHSLGTDIGLYVLYVLS